MPLPTASRWFTALTVMALVTALATSALASPSASIEQVRNGQATATTTPTPAWGTGNAGASNSHYLESHSTCYRTLMADLPTDGTVIELIIGYNVKRSGSYAIDYLTHYQRLLPHVTFGHSAPEVFNPLLGTTGVPSTFTTAPIPLPTRNLVIDPDGAESEPAMPQPATSMAALGAAEREMTLYGGNLIDVSYVTEGDVALATSSSETQIKVRFTATSPKAVLAWGGHIACRWDWGFNSDGTPRSAGGINGSSYHMRLVQWSLGSLGNQDRSMSTDAVYPVPRCGISNAGPFCAGTTNTHTAPSGMESYNWSLADNTSGASIVGSSTGTSIMVHSGTGGSYRAVVTTGASGFTKACETTVTVNPLVTADAGPSQTVCATSPQAQLAGGVGGGATAGSWIGGTGTFSPGRAVLNPTYTPSAAEITAGTVLLTLSTPGIGQCPGASDTVRIIIQRAATAGAGADQVVCATSPLVQLAGVFGGSATSGSWSGGAGTFTPGPTTPNATYLPSAAEIAAGTVSLTFTTDDPTGPCGAVSDQMIVTINPAATVNAGPDQTVCAASPQLTLAGSVGGAATTGTWSGGTGTFNPGPTTLNATYTPSAAEITAGVVTLTLTTNDPAGPCGAASDPVRLTINRSATANAGADQTVCATSPLVQLSGSLGGAAASGTWSGGSGTFTPGANALNATYLPSAAEIAAGGVTLTLTSEDPAGPCAAFGDQMRITINPAATVNAGPDQTVCATSPQAVLAGAVGGAATSGSWSGGTGTFSPSRTVLNPTYTPSAAEIAAGSVTLTLTTNDPSGPCPAVTDQVRININPAATVNAGPDQTVCASSPQTQLAGSIGGAAGSGTWSGGTGTFNPGPSSVNATYTPSATEIAAGSVTLTLTTNDPSGPCGAVSDQIRITINPAATVNAGVDRIVCFSSPSLALQGTVGGGATSGTWSGGTGTFSPSRTVLNPTYTPSAAEKAAGSVTLTLTTNDPAGPCPAVSDQVRITIDPITIVNAGIDVTVCSSSPQVQLQGAVSGTVNTGSWTGGTGTFSPGRTVLNPTYTPSAAEIAAGSVTLTLTSTASSRPCPAASDAITIFINRAVTVNAGPDRTVCLASPQVQLAGSLGSGATSGTWSGGTGTYNPSPNVLNPIYTPSAAEIAARGVTLTLTTNDPAGPCPAVNDQMRITIDAPQVTVPTRTVCSGIFPVTLCANVSSGVAPYTYRWSNGATTQCISVADTARYTVTITDAIGCQATGSGSFRYRDCVGMLAHTSVTCETYMDGTADELSSDEIHYNLTNNIISSIAPGVFFYYTKITAPRANFTVQVVQTKDDANFPYCPVLQGQVTRYDANCSAVGEGIETSPGQLSIPVTGATAGQVYIVRAKFSLKELIGSYLNPTGGVRYNFYTQIDGKIVDADPDGIQLGVPKYAAPSPEGPGLPAGGGTGTRLQAGELENGLETDGIDLYRAVPNPFTDGMRMAYAVGGTGERVSISVYDLAGRKVRDLASGVQAAGRHLATWDGRDDQGQRMHRGVYFVHVRIGDQARKVRVTFLQ